MQADHLSNVEELIDKIRSILLPRREVILAYLFGSFAKGTPYSHSDIDVAVLLDSDQRLIKEEYPYGFRSEVLADLMKGLHTNRIDLVILNDSPPFLNFQVIRHGRLIFARSETERIAFHVKAFAKYNDVKRLLNVQQKYLSERIRNGTYGKR